jgi:ABC-type branched-subunit amino acid transport system ATPase component
MKRGSIVAQGTVTELRADTDVMQAYLA